MVCFVPEQELQHVDVGMFYFHHSWLGRRECLEFNIEPGGRGEMHDLRWQVGVGVK